MTRLHSSQKGDFRAVGRLTHGDVAARCAELIEWIRNGGGFIGFHSATDTFRSGTNEVTPTTKPGGS